MPKDSNPLAVRMKAYEHSTEDKLDRTKPFLMRLDGHCFSKFTKQFQKPYDVRSMYINVQISVMSNRHV